MTMKRTIVTGGYVITMDDQLGDLPNGAVLIENDKIVGVAKSTEEFGEIEAEVIDAKGGIILPGMIDTHRHTWMSLLRAISADESLPEFLANTFYAYGAIVEPEDLGAATLVGALEALDSGVTTILDCCDCVNSPQHADAAVESLRTAGIRGVYAYGMQTYDYQPRSFHSHEDKLKDAARLRKEFEQSGDDLLRMGMLLTDFGTIPFEDTANEIQLAQEKDILVASHTGAVTSSNLLKGLRELRDNNLLLPGHVHIHCNGLNDQEWKLIGETGGKVSTSPETEIQMGMGFVPIRQCLDNGITPTWSTDIVCVGSGDLFSQMRLGLQFQRCIDNDKVHKTGTMPFTIDLSVRDALRWATHGGADALNLEKEVGSLTPGKKADMIIVSPERSFVPSSYPAGTVVTQTTAADIDTVIVNGEIRKRHGQLVGHDLEVVRTRAAAALGRMNKAVQRVGKKNPEEIGEWFGYAERMATVNYAGAYMDKIPAGH